MRLAVVCPLIAALFVGALDAVVGMRTAAVELGAGETAAMIVYACGRHLVGGTVLALLLLIVTALSRRDRVVDAGLVLLAAACSWFFLHATWDLFEGARISQHRFVSVFKAVARIGGPAGIFAGLAIGKAVLVRFLDPARLRAAGFVLAAACAAGAAFCVVRNARWLVGLYPGIHALLAAGALVFATLAAFFALRRGALGLASPGRRGPLVAFAGVVAAVFAASIVLHVSNGFERARANARGIIRGTDPWVRLIEPLYGAFEKGRTHDVGDVSAVLDAVRKTQDIDYRALLDRILPNRRKMNVLLVALDTVRWDHTSLAGYTVRPTTPNLQKLADSAFSFQHAYTPYPTSNYAYNAILTGLPAGASPLHGHRSGYDWKWPEDVFYPRLLARAGWHSNGVAAFDKKDRANQRFFGYVEKGFDVFNADQTFDRAMIGHEVTASVRKQITGRPKDPFFVFAHYIDPHDPYEIRPGFDFGSDTKARYDSEIAYTDAQLGLLLKLLDEQRLADNTIVAVFSDHGEALGDHGLTTHNSSLYDSEIRVPLVIRIPGLEPAKIRTPVSLIDIMPTVAQIIGVEDPVPRMGRSLLPWLLELGTHPDMPVFAEQYTVRQEDDDLEQRCVIYGGRKIIETVGRPRSTFLLFDLGADPGETRNLFGLPEHAAAQAEMLGLLAAAVKARDAYHDPGSQAASQPTAEGELRALVEKLRAPDVAGAQAAAAEIRNRLRSRYDEISERFARVDPGLLAAINDEAVRQADAALPKVRYDLAEILRLLGDEASAGYFRKLLVHPDGRARAEGARALALMGKEEARPVLEQVLAGIDDPIVVFPVAMALSALGDHARVAAYVPLLRSDSTTETAPLLVALRRAKDPAGLRILYERFTLNSLHDYRLKSLAIEYAATVGGPDADLVLAWLCDDADPGLRQSAKAALETRHGAEPAAALLERFRLEREAIAAQLNGKASLAAERYRAYVARYPDAEARVFMGLARALSELKDKDGVAEALRQMEARGGPDEKKAAARMLAHQKDLKWFYRPDAGEWKARIEVLDKPKNFVGNRSYFLRVKLTNDSPVFWAGGAWVFGPVLRTDVADSKGELFQKDARGQNITRREIPNFLPLSGVAPGESVELVVLGHVPSGQWKDGRVLVGFHQHGTTHIPPRGSWIATLPDPIEPK